MACKLATKSARRREGFDEFEVKLEQSSFQKRSSGGAASRSAGTAGPDGCGSVGTGAGFAVV